MDRDDRKEIKVSSDSQNMCLQHTLLKIATLIPETDKELSGMLREITAIASDALEVDQVSIFLLSGNEEELEFLDIYDRKSGNHKSEWTLKTKSFPCYLSALKSGSPINASDAQNDPRTREFRDEYLRPHGIFSLMDIPIRLSGTVAGAVCFAHAGEKREWRPEEACFAAGVANQVTRTIVDFQRRKSEFEMKKLSMAIDHSVNMVFITDSDGVIEYVNPAFTRLTGHSEKEALGRKPSIISSGETSPSLYQEMWTTILAGETWRGTFKNMRKSGEVYWGEGVVTPIRDACGKITHFLAVQEDVTEKKAAEERLKYLETYDNITSLFNRSWFIKALNDWLSRASASSSRGALLLLNLDQFKLVNDTYGHLTGDRVLFHVSDLIKAAIKAKAGRDPKKRGYPNIIGRLTADEFAIFLPEMGGDEALAVAEGLRKGVEKIRFGVIDGRLSASIGVVLYPDHGETTKDLLSRVDAAMYRCKSLGRNRCHLYRPEDHDLEKIHSRLYMKNRVIKALEERRFEPWLQPIMEIKSGRVHHFELLARMRDKKGKIIMPAAFIDIAERTGFIGAIDRSIIAQGLKLQAELCRSRDKQCGLTFSMNLSGKDLDDKGLLDYLKLVISETGADPGRLVFEITETAAISDLSKAVALIDSLKEIGCKFSLDDFGVGFTSFAYLKEMHVDYIKIDGSFIRDLHNNPNDQLFVKAMRDVAVGMGIKTIAEFVETGESLEILRALQVDFAQGYLIGVPAPPSEVLAKYT